MSKNKKQYIGDGVYVEFDGYNFILTTSNGYNTTNEIYLDRSVFKSLLIFVKTVDVSDQEQQHLIV